MALTRDVIKANAVLAALTDEQLAAIEALSLNDESSVIAQKTGSIYGDIDKDVLAVTGVAKVGTSEKTYEYLKRVLGEFKTKSESASDLQKSIDDLNKEKARLEKTITDGAGDAETKSQLARANAELAQTKTQFSELQTKLTEAEKTHNAEKFNMQVKHELGSATAGLKLKPEIPASAGTILIKQAVDKIHSMRPQYIDDGHGGQRLVFCNENGVPMNNPENKLAPYTAAELLHKELADVLDKGRAQPGGGTGPIVGGGGGSTTIDLSGAKNRTEATELATTALMAAGLTKGSEAFSSALTQAWVDGNIANLPEK